MTNALINKIDKHWRLANYISICQMYLKDNILLENKLQEKDLKTRCVGHWGVSPALNFVYAHVDSFNRRTNSNFNIIVGTGHAGCALAANLYIDGIITKFYPEYSYNYDGLMKFIKNFGNECGFRTEINPEYPLTIYDGGELGYALSVAYGSILDKKDTLTFCFIGDGEAETGTTSASWMINKFINKNFSGRVIPILNLNGNKMGSKSLMSMMSKKQLDNYFSSMSYHVIFVDGNHEEMYNGLEKIYSNPDENFIIILNSPKGWTAVQTDTIKVEGEIKSHKNPLSGLNENETKEYIELWLKSYKLEELYSKENGIDNDIIDIIPNYNLQYDNPHKELVLQCIEKYVTKEEIEKNINGISNYIADIINFNSEFRIFSPDELVSNGFIKLFDVTYNNIAYKDTKKDGKIIEVLNENICQGLMQGYIQTGRNALFIGYEAFMPIITSMISQLSKYIYQSKNIKWRNDISSFTYILTSVCWENNYSHQNPEFINSILNKEYDFVNVYMPIDSNSALVTLEKCINSKNCINVIVLSKKDNKQFEPIEVAYNDLKNGFNIIKEQKNEDVIIFASGDIIFNEVLETDKIIKKELPYIKTKIVYVNELKIFNNKKSFIYDVIRDDIPKIYVFHGYRSVLRNILYDIKNFTILGYKDKSNVSATLFKKACLNEISRYDIFRAVVKKLYEYKRVSYDEYLKSMDMKEREYYE